MNIVDRCIWMWNWWSHQNFSSLSLFFFKIKYASSEYRTGLVDKRAYTLCPRDNFGIPRLKSVHIGLLCHCGPFYINFRGYKQNFSINVIFYDWLQYIYMNTYEFHYCKIILPNSSLILLWLRAVCNRMKLYKLLLHVKQNKKCIFRCFKEKRIISFKICPNKRNF